MLPDWLKVRSGRDILIYSAWQVLTQKAKGKLYLDFPYIHYFKGTLQDRQMNILKF